MFTKEFETHWANIHPLLTIWDEDEYDAASARLEELLDDVGTDEFHPFCGLLDTLGTLLHAYEAAHHELPDCDGADTTRFFMEEHAFALHPPRVPLRFTPGYRKDAPPGLRPLLRSVSRGVSPSGRRAGVAGGGGARCSRRNLRRARGRSVGLKKDAAHPKCKRGLTAPHPF